jgi:hypothetical protein
MFYCPEAKGGEELSPGFQPRSADLMRGGSMGEWFFVPEGQPDSSQAPSAWVEMQRGPVPEGRSKAQSSRWDEAIFFTIPGTSCLATIGLSLRTKYTRPPGL